MSLSTSLQTAIYVMPEDSSLADSQPVESQKNKRKNVPVNVHFHFLLEVFMNNSLSARIIYEYRSDIIRYRCFTFSSLVC